MLIAKHPVQFLQRSNFNSRITYFHVHIIFSSLAQLLSTNCGCYADRTVLHYVLFHMHLSTMVLERIWKWRGTGPAQKSGRARTFFLIMPFHFIGSKSTISRFGEHFRDGQYSLVSFLFAVLLLMVYAMPSYL